MTGLVLIDKKFESIGLELYRFIKKNLEDRLCIKSCYSDELSNLEESDVFYIFSTWMMPSIDDRKLDLIFPDLKAVFYAAGDSSYFRSAFESRGVQVFDCHVENSTPVAEGVLGLILLSNKGYFRSVKKYESPLWRYSFRKSRIEAEQRSGNYKPQIGLLGYGLIARNLIELMKPFDFDIRVNDPYCENEIRELSGIKYSSKEEIFLSCDVVSVHLPLNIETKGIIDKNLLLNLKKNATLINTSRGKVIDERGLAQVAFKRKDVSFLLDVTTYEPIFPWSPLLYLSNVSLSPHILGSTGNEVYRLFDRIKETFDEFIS